MKDKLEIISREQPMTRKQRMAMEKFAEFMARMIEKYGRQVLAKIEAEEVAKKAAEKEKQD